LAIGVVVWWLVIQSGPEPSEPPPVRVEAEGLPDEPIEIPAASAPPTPVISGGVGDGGARTAAAPAGAPPTARLAGPARVAAPAALAGALPPTPLEGPIRVAAKAVRWDAPGRRPFFYADSVTGVLDAGELNRGSVLVTEAALVRPRIVIERAAGASEWNYEQVFDRLARDADDGATRAGGDTARSSVRFHDVTVEDGAVAANVPGLGTLRFTAVDALLSRIDVSVPGEPT